MIWFCRRLLLALRNSFSGQWVSCGPAATDQQDAKGRSRPPLSVNGRAATNWTRLNLGLVDLTYNKTFEPLNQSPPFIHSVYTALSFLVNYRVINIAAFDNQVLVSLFHSYLCLTSTSIHTRPEALYDAMTRSSSRLPTMLSPS